ncbi:MAG: hypothetical protein M3N16_01675 [Actinomycetota bacterium]|nr:hypothetical protein [Actinomycetota bacterium]
MGLFGRRRRVVREEPVVYEERSPGYARSFGGGGVFGALYLVLGVLVAAAYDYFEHLTRLRGIVSALLAVLLWPLLLLGIELRVS